VLARRELVFHPAKRTTRSEKRPIPEWIEQVPNRIWIYDTTHWSRLDAATTAINDVVSKKWLGEITSHDETSIQVQAVFTRALHDEGLLDQIEELAASGETMSLDPDDDRLPVLLVMSDNGPQMTSGSTREFMALCWLATHYGRPGTPTDQAQMALLRWSIGGRVAPVWRLPCGQIAALSSSNAAATRRCSGRASTPSS